MKLDPRIPSGPLAEKWDRRRSEARLVSPANKRRYRIVVVGSGLAGAAAAATLAELGYRVDCLCFQDSPRRAHSVAAQGGINAAKNYRNDGDSVWRLFHDTIAGGDFRSREANVYRLAQLSLAIIDQCTAQGVPFAREYGGLLENRSFGGVQVSRTFYCRGQTGQQLLIGAYGALCRQVELGAVRMFPRKEMLDLVTHDGRARGVIARDLVTGDLLWFEADAVVLATGGYTNAYRLTTNAVGCNATAIFRAWKRGAGFANPSFTQIHPTCIPPSGGRQSKLTLMSESLRNDARMWVPRSAGDDRPPDEIPEAERDYFLERRYPRYGNLVPRDVASRATKRVCDEGRGVGPGGRGVYLDLGDAVERLGRRTIEDRYGNLFEMYQRITGEDAWRTPMRIYPAPHYSMGGLWVDYDLMSTVPGLFVIGEANFSDHGANRLGASALMQGLADGYFILPVTIGDYLAGVDPRGRSDDDRAAFVEATERVAASVGRLLVIGGKRPADDFHRELGAILWESCGMTRTEAGLRGALQRLPALRAELWQDLRVPGSGADLNAELEKAGRVADFIELGELMVRDALAREESCGTHFRTEHATCDGYPIRDDEAWSVVSVWEHDGDAGEPAVHREPLGLEAVELAARRYD